MSDALDDNRAFGWSHDGGPASSLSADKIIEHHNAIWSDFIAPRGPALVRPCAALRLST
jgi:hypothetical protein